VIRFETAIASPTRIIATIKNRINDSLPIFLKYLNKLISKKDGAKIIFSRH
jgi:hypothetical protein